MTEIILASASPRRKQLLRDAGVRFSVFAVDADENVDGDLAKDPADAAQKIAERKAGAVVQTLIAQGFKGDAVVIAADTMVVCDGEIFGKPRDVYDGTRMLKALSGKTHEVITGVSVWQLVAGEEEKVSLGYRDFADSTKVTFKELTDPQIADYLCTGEARDKAGAYAIQGAAAEFIEGIEGDYDNVVGLPVGKLLEMFPDLKGADTTS